MYSGVRYFMTHRRAVKPSNSRAEVSRPVNHVAAFFPRATYFLHIFLFNAEIRTFKWFEVAKK